MRDRLRVMRLDQILTAGLAQRLHQRPREPDGVCDLSVAGCVEYGRPFKCDGEWKAIDVGA